MWFKLSLLIQYIILCTNYEFITAKAMIGQNVRPANVGEFNFVVPIKKINNENPNFEKDYLCTGTLISKKDVLTVEHCFKFCPPNLSEIIVGSIDLRHGRKFHLSKLITYFMWAVKIRKPFFQQHDIAIAKLSEAVPDDIKPVALSTLTYPFTSGLDVVIAGWGENNSGKTSMIMETVPLKVISSIECITKLNQLQVKISSLHIKNICTIADPYAIMCAGNSGSPVLHNGALLAIHQATCPFPNEPLHPKKINLNLSIDYFRNFIVDTINSS